MRISPPWIIALALTVLGGAVSGASIGTAPVVERGLELPRYQTRATAPRTMRPADPVALPDHYALETPDGRVEAGELALRGRLHARSAARYLMDEPPASAEPFRRSVLTARERAYYAYDAVPANFSAEPPPSDRSRPDLAYQSAAHAPPRANYAQTPPLSRAEAPLALAEPAPVAAAPAAPASANIGKARMIDVSASLASRE